MLWTSELGRAPSPGPKTAVAGAVGPWEGGGTVWPSVWSLGKPQESTEGLGARLSPPGAASLASSPTLTTPRPLRLPVQIRPSLCSGAPLLC